MPPHCDTRDGPVARAAALALETGRVSHVLIWVPAGAEPEVKAAFERARKARMAGGEARSVADDWFFETAIRLHRAGEGEGFTGMKPAGLSEGPVVPVAEKAIESGNPQETIDLLLGTVEDEMTHRFHLLEDRKQFDPDDVAAGRAYIEAYIGWVVFSHHLHAFVKGGGHGGHREGCGCGH